MADGNLSFEAISEAIDRAKVPIELPVAKTGPKFLTIRHHEIMDYLMANPSVKLRDVANHFGVTQPWLSQIIHSDLFQQLLSDKQGIAFHDTVLGIREKMINTAHQALDRLSERLPEESDVGVLSSTAEGILDRLGFGVKPSPGSGNTYNTQVNVLASEVQAARELLYKRNGGPPLVGLDGKCVALPVESAPALGAPLQATAISSPQTEGEERATGDKL